MDAAGDVPPPPRAPSRRPLPRRGRPPAPNVGDVIWVELARRVAGGLLVEWPALPERQITVAHERVPAELREQLSDLIARRAKAPARVVAIDPRSGALTAELLLPPKPPARRRPLPPPPPPPAPPRAPPRRAPDASARARAAQEALMRRLRGG